LRLHLVQQFQNLRVPGAGLTVCSAQGDVRKVELRVSGCKQEPPSGPQHKEDQRDIDKNLGQGLFSLVVFFSD
jgi:hypothetical protein